MSNLENNITVINAVYGALNGGNENQSQAFDVTKEVQAAINTTQGINNFIP